jgi:hypothetical protein
MKNLLLSVLCAASIVAVPSFARAEVECYTWIDEIGGGRYRMTVCCDENGCWVE